MRFKKRAICPAHPPTQTQVLAICSCGRLASRTGHMEVAAAHHHLLSDIESFGAPMARRVCYWEMRV